MVFLAREPVAELAAIGTLDHQFLKITLDAYCLLKSHQLNNSIVPSFLSIIPVVDMVQ